MYKLNKFQELCETIPPQFARFFKACQRGGKLLYTRFGGLDKNAKYYIIGLLGGKSSGKTCFLTILAMTHKATPGYAARLVPATIHDSEELRRGYDWINRCITCIEKGLTPPNTPKETYRIRFVVTHGGQEHYVEFIEYPGEALARDNIDGELSGLIMKYLRDVDVLFVVGEAPSPTATAEERNELAIFMGYVKDAMTRVLEQFKTRYHKKHPPFIPVSLLITKWDRCQVPLEDFLISPEGDQHGTLMTILKGATNHFAEAFPVSAFGPSQKNEVGLELPIDLSPIKSSGLEEPLIWALEARTKKDVEQLQSRSNARQLRWNLFKTDQAVSVTARTLDRLPKDSPEWLAVKQVQGKLARLRKIQNMAVVAVICFLGLLWECMVDSSQHSDARQKLRSDSKLDWAASKSWYLDYNRSSWYRHTLYGILYSRGAIVAEWNQLWKGKTDQFWARAVDSTDHNTRSYYADLLAEADPTGSMYPVKELKELLGKINPDDFHSLEGVQKLEAIKDTLPRGETDFITLKAHVARYFWPSLKNKIQKANGTDWKQIDQATVNVDTHLLDYRPYIGNSEREARAELNQWRQGLRARGFGWEYKKFPMNEMAAEKLDSFLKEFIDVSSVYKPRVSARLEFLRKMSEFQSLRIVFKKLNWPESFSLVAENGGPDPRGTFEVGTRPPVTVYGNNVSRSWPDGTLYTNWDGRPMDSKVRIYIAIQEYENIGNNANWGTYSENVSFHDCPGGALMCKLESGASAEVEVQTFNGSSYITLDPPYLPIYGTLKE